MTDSAAASFGGINDILRGTSILIPGPFNKQLAGATGNLRNIRCEDINLVGITVGNTATGELSDGSYEVTMVFNDISTNCFGGWSYETLYGKAVNTAVATAIATAAATAAATAIATASAPSTITCGLGWYNTSIEA